MSAYRTGFSPFRYHPGRMRRLSAIELALIGSACPHCDHPLVRSFSRFSEYIHCPAHRSIYADPDGSFRTLKELLHEVIARPVLGEGEVMARIAEILAAGTPTAEAAVVVDMESPFHVKEAVKYRMRTTPKPPVPTLHAKAGGLKMLRKLSGAVQSAYREGKIGAGFSLRRELMAARLWTYLKPHEAVADAKEMTAMQVAFAVVAGERAPAEERPFYEELWRAQTGTDLYPLPTMPLLNPSDEKVWHPQAGLACIIVQSGLPLWLTGEAGNGKTFLTRQIARWLGLRYVRIQGSRDRTIDEVIGAWGYDAKVGSVFRYGVLAEAARGPTLAHIDEVSAMPHEVNFEMHALLEGQPLSVLKHSGETLPLHPEFRIVANDNSIGEGERAEYVGTAATNLAFRDRWVFLRIDEMPESVRQQLLEDEVVAVQARIHPTEKGVTR